MTEKLANLSWQSVLIIVAVLLVFRYALMKVEMPFAKSVAEIAESLAVAMALVFFIIRPFLIQAFFIPSGSMYPTLLEDDHIIVNKLGYRLFKPTAGDVVVFRAPADWDQQDHTEKDYIKRLMGLPGDTLEVKAAEFRAGEQLYDRAEVEARLIDHNYANFNDREIRCKYVSDGIITSGGRKIPKKEIASWFGVPEDELVIKPGRTFRNGKVLDESYTFEDPGYDLEKVKIPPGEFAVMGDNRNNSNDSHINGFVTRDRLIGKAKFIFWPPGRLGIIR